MENPNAPLNQAESATVAAWMEMLDTWVMNPNVGGRFMYILHRAVLATYAELLGEHATLQSAEMAIQLEEMGAQQQQRDTIVEALFGEQGMPEAAGPAYPGESNTPLSECPCHACVCERSRGMSHAVDTSDAPSHPRFART